MAARKKQDHISTPQRPPATTPEDREQQLMAAAVDLAEEQILNGTASTPVITHYLKLASSRERLEQERIIEQIKLDAIKAKAIEQSAQTAEITQRAYEAFTTYVSSADKPVEDVPREIIFGT